MTTTYKKILLLAALPALLLASCSQEEMAGDPGGSADAQNGDIRFEIGFAPQDGAAQTEPQTRVATSADELFNSSWEDGDAIGIFAVPHGTALAASGNFIHNVKLTYDGSTWTASEGIYWPKDGTRYDFYAYHPYDASLTDPTKNHDFYVQSDQSASTSGKSHFSLSDLMYAKADNNGSGYGRGETVALAFKHLMAMVQVKVSSSMVGSYPPDALNVWLNGCTTGCVLNLSAQSTTQPAAPAIPQQIKMYPCPNDGSTPGIYAYRALVPVQTIASNTAMFRFDYGGNVLLRSQPLADGLSLAEGRVETFDMTFPFTSVTVSETKRLADLLADNELAAITHLKVLGKMTEADFTTIKEKMPKITSLDLGGATVEENTIPMSALYGKHSLTEFVFPRGVTTIHSNAFYGCSGLSGSLTIPNSVTMIGKSAFQGCSNLSGLTISNSVTSIAGSAFEGCSGLSGNLTIPNSVTRIGDSAFFGCSGFSGSLTILNSVIEIGSSAFSGCSNITSIYCYIENPDIIYGLTIFKDVPATIPVNVPAAAVDVYMNHDVWKQFSKIQPITP